MITSPPTPLGVSPYPYPYPLLDPLPLFPSIPSVHSVYVYCCPSFRDPRHCACSVGGFPFSTGIGMDNMHNMDEIVYVIVNEISKYY